MKTFLPYEEIRNREVIMVDGNYSRGLVLSHWRGSGSPPEAADDTSAGIVLNALKMDIPGLEIPFVTANHYDIDGFIGVWALMNPQKALDNEDLLMHIACIGDFREIDFIEPEWKRALKIVCWLNKIEKDKFYPPFGMWETDESEIKECGKKFKYFLEAFEDVFHHVDKYREIWEDEYRTVLDGIEKLKDAAVSTYPAEGLVIIETPEPVHYFSLFSLTKGYDIVLSIYSHHCYELEYKYTTWVDIVSRPTLPRIGLSLLSAKLNALEKSAMNWTMPKITDTGPVLRIEDSSLTRAELFESPMNRLMYSSSIPPQQIKDIVLEFYEEAYEGIKPKRYWTWKEMRELNAGLISPLHNA